MADTKPSAFPLATLPLGLSDQLLIFQGGVWKRVDREDSPGLDITKALTATQANSTTTPAAVTGLTAALATGQYLVKYWLCYRAAATTTGVEFYLDMNPGVVSRIVTTWYTLTTGSAAATGVADQATTGVIPQTVVTTQQLMEGRGQRTDAYRSGHTFGVDTANSDQFAVLEGIVIVTTAGDLNLMFSSEVAASAITMMEGSAVTIQKTG